MITEKICKDPNCEIKEAQSIENFHWKSKRKGTRQPKCKTCMSRYGKTHYEANSDDYKARANERLKLLRSTNRENVKTHLSTHPCSKCGNANVKVLSISVTSAEINNMAPEALLAKLAESVVLCRNCKVSQD